MNSLPSKQELLSYQDRWQRRAGFAGFGGALIVAVSIIAQRAGLHLPDSNSDADQLVFAHAHSGRLIYTSVLQAFGFVLFTIPLYFLFRSASGRAERMRGAFAGLIILGPLAFGIGLAVSSVGTGQAADDFVKQEPAVVQSARQQALQAQAAASAPPKAKGKSAQSTTTTQSATATPSTSTTSTTTATDSTATPAAAAPKPKTPDQAASDAREGLADHLNRHNTVLIVGGVLSTIGVLGLVFGTVYTNIWCMRTGLLSRFWGALGIAFGLFLIIPLFPPVPGLILWFAAIGLMLAGLWPRPLPPAWAAGEAIPWQRRGDDLGPPPAERGPAGTVEGSGREVSEQPLPDDGGQNGEPPDSETQGQRRKKRKRRR